MDRGSRAGPAAAGRPRDDSLADALEAIRRVHTRGSLQAVEEAVALAAEAGPPSGRLGSPGVTARILAELRLDPRSVALGVLFAGEVAPARVAAHEDRELKGLADDLERLQAIARLAYRPRTPAYPELFRRLVLSIAGDGRTVLVRLAERAARLERSAELELSARTETAREALEVAAPIAHRLGVAMLRRRIEELGFRYLDPELYAELERDVRARISGGEGYIQRVARTLADEIRRAGIEAQVVGRIKSLYSVHYKMRVRQCPLDQVFDLIALRVIVPANGDCYAALGIIHSLWRAVPGRFKDYIAIPKPNGYRSLHTTVLGPDGRMLEVQIRTFEMHAFAENGIAVHWIYKAGLSPGLEGTAAAPTPGSALFYPDRIYVFTPRDDLVELPRGATAIDLAYRIHTDLGNRCAGARADGQILPLRRPLATGQQIEILASARAEPRESWLEFAVTSRARSKIRRWLRLRSEEQARVEGEKLLARHLRRRNLARARLERGTAAQAVLQRLGFPSLDDLLASAGRRKKRGELLIQRLLDEVEGRPAAAEGEIRSERPSAPRARVEVRGMGMIQVNLSRCCHPAPGDPIVGYITRGRGVSIHRLDCPNLGKLSQEPERLVDANWAR